jgi:tyrosyl-tRNA synthetase
MFGKVMRISDELMASYFELLTEVPEDEIARLTDPAKYSARDAKEQLAKTIITQYHSANAAEAAAEEFRRVHAGGSGGGLPDNVPEVILPADKISGGKIVPIDLIVHCGFEKSRSEARRLVAERGVRLNGDAIEDAVEPVAIKGGDILQRGKRRFVRLTLP